MAALKALRHSESKWPRLAKTARHGAPAYSHPVAKSATRVGQPAISKAQRGEVAVYTVSTRDEVEERPDFVGDHALRDLSELTGGAAFMPGAVRNRNHSLAELQQAIRGRYLVSYKPASFHRDGKYRAVEITAKKDGHPLKVFAPKGYYAQEAQTRSADR